MMTDEAFARLVSDEVKNNVSTEQRAYLRRPENQDRWRATLVALRGTVIEQIKQMRRDLEREKNRVLGLPDPQALILELEYSFGEKIRKTQRFCQFVEGRIEEVDRLKAAASAKPEDRLDLFNLLMRAIESHRALVEAHFYPSAVDRALWAAMDGKWEFDDLIIDDEDSF